MEKKSFKLIVCIKEQYEEFKREYPDIEIVFQERKVKPKLNGKE